jgi:hypothetical protein
MTVPTDGDVRTSADPQQPRRSELREPEAAQARHLDADDGDEAIEGDQPVLEATDISGVTQAQLPTAQSTEPTEVDPLFGQDAAADFRSRWDVVQRSFVDDPKQAVRDGDELVTQVIEALRQTFAAQRTEFEKDTNPDGTETLRLALRRYRSFFERLLAI